MTLKRTCKQVAAILIAREDRELSLGDRVALRLHLLACDTCPVFARQLDTMRRAFSLWRSGGK
jgi:hypothetical protein